MPNIRISMSLAFMGLLVPAAQMGIAQPVGGSPVLETRPTATAPAEQEGPAAVAVRVVGKVLSAPVVPLGGVPQWTPVREGQRLAAGTQLRTGIRSSVLLQFGDNVIVQVDRVTSATIAQFYQTARQQSIRIDLGYGAVRAGAVEGMIESDMTIQTPVATLTKRGTWGFGLEYEAVTGRFRAFLADRGLIDVINQLTNQRQSLAPGQYVTQAMIHWIQTAKFDRTVPIQDVFGLTRTETEFQAYQGDGMGVLQPGGSSNFNTAGRDPAALYADITGEHAGQLTGLPPGAFITQPGGGTVFVRPEGNFGTGGAVLPKDLLQSPGAKHR